MSTLSTTNIKHPSSGSNNLVLDASGNTNFDSGTLYVDATNNRVGIGTTAPEEVLDVSGPIKSRARGTINGSGTSGVTLSYDTSSSLARLETWNSKPISIETNGSERLRVDTSGRLLVGTSSAATVVGVASFHNIKTSTNSAWATNIEHAGTAAYGLTVTYTGASPNNSGNEFLLCRDSTAVRAYIRSDGGFVNYQANNANLSDRNAKKDITPAANTWECIKDWEIVNYRYKDQPDDADLNLGVIAQQVAEICPEVITVFQEATEDEPEKLGVKEQQMYWMAIKALQEAQVRIEALEAEVAALKAQ